MTLVALIFLDLALIVLLDAAVVRPIARHFHRHLGARRLGQLPIAVVPTAETADEDRQARLRQLGAAGTCRIYNCGKILHVDYDRGELVIERELP